MKKTWVQIASKDGDSILRLWIDQKGKTYKVEIRTPHYLGYMNPDEFWIWLKKVAKFGMRI